MTGRRPVRRLASVAAAIAVLAGCGGVAGATRATHPVTAPRVAVAGAATTCAHDVALTLGRIAAGVYAQAAQGRNVQSSRRRLAGSPALARAVSRGDAAAAQAALRPLIEHQIVRIDVRAHGRRLATFGTQRALAPVHGRIDLAGRVVGTYVMSVAGERSIAGEIHTITGSRVVIRAGSSRAAARTLPAARVVDGGGRRDGVASFDGRAYPAGALGMRALIPGRALHTCGATTDATATVTIGAVGRRLLAAEAGGAALHRVLRVVGHDRGFSAAVAAHDPVAMRAAVLRLFKDRNLHVVRIAATLPDGSRLADVGGPYALAAASGPVVAAGRRVGTVTLSVQDDTGYIKLVHRFTGAAVSLRLPSGVVPGSMPAPRGPHRTYAFDAAAFDGTPLHITLMVPDGLLSRR